MITVESHDLEHPMLTERPQATVDSVSRESSWVELLTELAYRKRLIAKITGCAMILSIALALLLPARYTAITKVMPPQQTFSSESLLMSQMVAPGSGAVAALADSALGLENPNDIYIGLLNSRPVADAIIRAFNLCDVYHAADMTLARTKLSDNTTIVTEKSGLLAISVTDRDKKRAAAIANSYTAQLRILTKSLAVTEASQRRLFYDEQLAQAGNALVAAELAFEQVQQANGLVSLDAQSKAMIEGLADLQAQIAAKQVQIQAMRSYSTDRNPNVELARQELSTLQSEAERLEVRNPVLGSGKLGFRDVPSAGQAYLSAQHELAYRQTLYDMLIKQYDAARLDEAKEGSVIQVVEPAIEPDRKSSPKRALIGLAGTLFGFFAAVFWVLITMALERARQNAEIDLQFAALSAALSAGFRGRRDRKSIAP